VVWSVTTNPLPVPSRVCGALVLRTTAFAPSRLAALMTGVAAGAELLAVGAEPFAACAAGPRPKASIRVAAMGRRRRVNRR
jgi:hypothetical protein